MNENTKGVMMNTQNAYLPLRFVLANRMVALCCLFSLLLLPVQQAAASMEFYHYDINGSLLDVFNEANTLDSAQRWDGGWGKMPSTTTTDLMDGKPSMLGYHGMRPIASAAFWLGTNNELYNPVYKRNLTQGTDDSASFVFNDNSALLNEKINSNAFSARPGRRNGVYWGTVLGVGALAVAACLGAEAVGAGIACFATKEAFASFTLYFGTVLTVVGIGESAAFCSKAYSNRKAGRNYDVAGDRCVGALSVLHTGGRIALSGLFSGEPLLRGVGGEGVFGELVGDKIEMGWPSINQALYMTGFTAINSSTQLAGAGARGNLEEHGTRKIIVQVGINIALALSDTYTLPWLKRIGMVEVETDTVKDIDVTWGKSAWFGISYPLKIEMQMAIRNAPIGSAWAYRFAEIPFIYAVDLASRRNLSGPVNGKNALCQLYSTLLYQGLRIGIANLPPSFARAANGKLPSSAGSNIGRAAAAGGGNLLAFNQNCSGQYDSIF